MLVRGLSLVRLCLVYCEGGRWILGWFSEVWWPRKEFICSQRCLVHCASRIWQLRQFLKVWGAREGYIVSRGCLVHCVGRR